MVQRTRREFLAEVGRGMVTASVGWAVAADLDLDCRLLRQDPEPLSFGLHASLVDRLLDTPPERLLPALAELHQKGTSLQQVITAAALANARTFGGEDYVGFHTMMAFGAAYRMAMELPPALQPLPVWKVLYRNATRLREVGGRTHVVLHALPPDGKGDAGQDVGLSLRDAVRARDLRAAEQALAAAAGRAPAQAMDALLCAVADGAEVHRVALAHRAFDLLLIVGGEHALTLLRQSVHYCVRNEPQAAGSGAGLRTMLPALLERHHLLDAQPGTRVPDDDWLLRTSQTIFTATPADAADCAASALAEGIAPDAVGEAFSLAANQLLLRDQGRKGREIGPGKAAGTVHGDSIGLHASDSAHAWRSMAAAGSARSAFACTILGAWQAAKDRVDRGGDFLHWPPLPHAPHLAAVEGKTAPELLAALQAAIAAGDQGAAAAAVHRHGELGLPAAPVFDVLRNGAIQADGALHAEKYFGTVSDEFARGRAAFRWRHVAALARATASQHGMPAPGYGEARELLCI